MNLVADTWYQTLRDLRSRFRMPVWIFLSLFQPFGSPARFVSAIDENPGQDQSTDRNKDKNANFFLNFTHILISDRSIWGFTFKQRLSKFSALLFIKKKGAKVKNNYEGWDFASVSFVGQDEGLHVKRNG